MGNGTLALDAAGKPTQLQFADGFEFRFNMQGPVCFLETETGSIAPTLVEANETTLKIAFEDGSTARFALESDPDFTLFRLKVLDLKTSAAKLRLFRLPIPKGASVSGTLNGYFIKDKAVALMAGTPDVLASTALSGSRSADRPGCSHQFQQTTSSKHGNHAANFTATCDIKPAGWSMRGRTISPSMDIKRMIGLSAWIHGDGLGEQLKFQLDDGKGGARDYYVPVDFTGWRHVQMTSASLDTMGEDRLAGLNLYYNSVPSEANVACVIDDIRGIFEEADGTTSTVLIEDFEQAESPWWTDTAWTLNLEMEEQYGYKDAVFGIIACPEERFFDVVQKFEAAAGIPVPHPGGVWNKRSPLVQKSYLFLQSFSEAQFDDALALAKRGGFEQILLGQGSWCQSTGHYEVNRKNFPDGLPGLVRMVKRFRDEGIDVGLHLLGASIDSNDPYITPVPDPRLVTDASTTLTTNMDEVTTTVIVEDMPVAFPREDGGYEGKGTVLRIGDELISYGERTNSAPYTFTRCKRGYLGTRAAAHLSGAPVQHLARSFGYHMFDMDTTLLDEVTSNFVAVANACDIGMLYFDGSEWLQGDHRRYNARLLKAYVDKLNRKDIIIQASSYSHYSWHLLARSASADGHGDLKGYLEERSPGFALMERDGMPLDIGWYYGYDASATPDMYEYILGTTIGYGGSFSYQASVAAAQKHPFTGEILDLIKQYELLRLSGRVPETMRKLLQVAQELMGRPPEDTKRPTELRRDYHLTDVDGKEAFQRIVYTPWKTASSPNDELSWKVEVTTGPAQIGLQIQAQSGPWTTAGVSYTTSSAILLEGFDDLDGWVGDGKFGTTSDGVTQTLTLSTDHAPEGTSFAVYTASSSSNNDDGWACFPHHLDSPIDLSKSAGLGLWLRADGNDGLFKVQLLSGKDAVDHYIPNDYIGWRYHQLPRPSGDKIDYSTVTALNLYFNTMPANTQLSCGIDGIKAIPALDNPTVKNPWVEVAGQRMEWKGDMAEGQYLFLEPDKPAMLFGAPLSHGTSVAAPQQIVILSAGAHEVRFGYDKASLLALRVRLIIQPPENHIIPIR